MAICCHTIPNPEKESRFGILTRKPFEILNILNSFGMVKFKMVSNTIQNPVKIIWSLGHDLKSGPFAI
jgi:hypothetical protein